MKMHHHMIKNASEIFWLPICVKQDECRHPPHPPHPHDPPSLSLDYWWLQFFSWFIWKAILMLEQGTQHQRHLNMAWSLVSCFCLLSASHPPDDLQSWQENWGDNGPAAEHGGGGGGGKGRWKHSWVKSSPCPLGFDAFSQLPHSNSKPWCGILPPAAAITGYTETLKTVG